MNLPNKLTLSRIFLTVVFMFLLFAEGAPAKCLALGVFLLASLTDYWDGKIARAKNQRTSFGKLMDPIADKLLSLSAFLAFVQMEIIPAWMVMLIIARDLLITGLRLLAPPGHPVMAVRSSGKHKTTLQFTAIVAVLVFLAVRDTPFWKAEWTPSAHTFIAASMFFVVAVTLWSGLRVVYLNREIFSAVR